MAKSWWSHTSALIFGLKGKSVGAEAPYAESLLGMAACRVS